jgi:hypothetical protein
MKDELMLHRRLRVILRLRALQDSAQTEIRRLLRVLLIWHQHVAADAAVGRLLQGPGYLKLVD